MVKTKKKKKAKPFKLKEEENHLYEIWLGQVTLNNYYEFKVCQSPFGNCQNFSLLNAYVLLQYPQKEFDKIIFALRDMVQKQVLIIDIETKYLILLKKFNNIGRTRVLHKYKNTNTSTSMAFVRIKFNNKYPNDD